MTLPTAGSPPAPSSVAQEAQLDAERRSLLGDSRSPDRMTGDELARFVEVCGQLRALKRAKGEIPAKPGRAVRKTIDLADL